MPTPETPAVKTQLTLFNTLRREFEIFKPLDPDGPVRMYNCGPTVYDYQHIGNLRAYVFVDTLRRALEVNGYEVKQIINITDVGHLVSDGDTGEDKMTKGLKKEGLEVNLENMKQLGEKYADIFKADLEKLHVKKPHAFPKASEFIEADIEFVEALVEKGYTYTTSDGVYFDTTKREDYGKLAGGIAADDELETRVDNDEKKNPRDFAVWKFDEKLGWDSPFGRGFPGWHIECSVMSYEYLGESFDIHTGGVDHIAVHHTNEIAQSEAATGQPMARFWLHNDFITINDDKISKSVGNTLYLKSLIDRGFDPLAYRYLLLTARYRTQMNFSWEALEAAQNTLTKLYRHSIAGDANRGTINDVYWQQFMTAINDDLNTPEALAVVWNMIGDDEVSDNDQAATLLAFDEVLGLDLASIPHVEVPKEVQELVKQRQKARQEDDFETADTLRAQIREYGFVVNDTEEGYEIVPAD